ncbi:hypothetical protein GCM10009735_22480 [Actinomadura chokoriensis]
MTGPSIPPDNEPASAQGVHHSDVADSVFQVKDVRGDVTINTRSAGHNHPPPGRLGFLANPRFLGAVAFAALVAIVIPGAFYVRGQITHDARQPGLGAAPSQKNASEAEIEIVDMLVDTPPAGRRLPASLDIKLLNTGDRRSVIKRAIVSIRKFSLIEVCFSQGGGLDVSATYGLTMPVHPTPGQELEVPLSQEIGPDEADRFKLNLRLPEAAAEVGRNLDAERFFVYHIGVQLVRDRESHKVNAGDAVVVLPGPFTVNPQDFFLTKEFDRHPNRYDAYHPTPQEMSHIRECLASNNTILHGFMSVNGAKPTWFSQIKSQLID